MLVEVLDGPGSARDRAAPPPLPGRPEPACPTPCRACGPRARPRLPPRNGASSAGTSARSPPKAPPPLPGSAPPIPSGSECSKTPPCAPPEGLTSGASNPSQKGQTYRKDHALPKPDISSAIDRRGWARWQRVRGVLSLLEHAA